MFVGYNLKMEKQNLNYFRKNGIEYYNRVENSVRSEIDKFINSDGSINADVIQEE